MSSCSSVLTSSAKLQLCQNNGYAFFQPIARCQTRLSTIRHTLGIEILALAIKQNPTIESIRIGACKINITQYADDDTTVFLKTLNQ